MIARDLLETRVFLPFSVFAIFRIADEASSLIVSSYSLQQWTNWKRISVSSERLSLSAW